MMVEPLLKSSGDGGTLYSSFDTESSQVDTSSSPGGKRRPYRFGLISFAGILCACAFGVVAFSLMGGRSSSGSKEEVASVGSAQKAGGSSAGLRVDIPQQLQEDSFSAESGYEQVYRVFKNTLDKDGLYGDPSALRDKEDLQKQLQEAVEKDMKNSKCWFGGPVSIRDEEKATHGFTLFSEMYKPSGEQKDVRLVEGLQWTYLTDTRGRLVHSWYTPQYPNLFSPKLLPNGSLLRMAWGNYEPQFSTEENSISYVQEMHWDGYIIKSCRVATKYTVGHHDVWKTEAGTYLMPVWKRATAEYCIHSAGMDPNSAKAQRLFAQGSAYGCMIDGIQEFKMVSTDFEAPCEVIWEWWSSDHFVQDRNTSQAHYGNITMHPELLDANFVDATEENFRESGQPQTLHLNSINYHEELKQILVSSFVTGEVYIIDHTTTTAEAASHSGGQHGMGGDFLYRAGNPKAYRRSKYAHHGEGRMDHNKILDLDQRLFYKCHTARWIPKGYPGEGNILVFSNGFNLPRDQQISAAILANSSSSFISYSAAVEFSTPLNTSLSLEGEEEEEDNESEGSNVDGGSDYEGSKSEGEVAPLSPTRQLLNRQKKNRGNGYKEDPFPEGPMEPGATSGSYNYKRIKETQKAFSGELTWVWNDIYDGMVKRFGGAERLANGNTFVTMSNGPGGWRLMEVTPDGEVVWRMRPPLEASNVREESDRQVFRAHKYPPTFAGFTNRTLKPICSPPVADRVADAVFARVWNPPF